MDTTRIRNFCIIAHIDHGKSTLADRFLLRTSSISSREFREQVLDDMDLERERGITIKARAVTMSHTIGGSEYMLNLIDTPGHVDFSYEVSRSLTACDGALLLVDATQGVEAQTLANMHLAFDLGIEIIPVINKIDLPNAMVDDVILEMENSLGMLPEEIQLVSAKTGEGVDELMETIIRRIPSPQGKSADPQRALIFDAVYDEFRGVIVYIRSVDGKITRGDRIKMLSSDREYEATEVGKFRPRPQVVDSLSSGEVGYLVPNIKTLQDVRIGDTITLATGPSVEALPGYVEPLPMVFCGLYPTNHTDYDALRKALEKLQLNDSSFTFQPETSEALGFGFRCGFLGLLHMDIVQERLERESGLSIVQTAANVTYEVAKTDGSVIRIDSPGALPNAGVIDEIREPVIRLSILIPADSIGAAMKLAEERRGKYIKTEYLSSARALLEYKIPLAEIIFDFYDKLKSATRGYGTMDYEFDSYNAADLIKLRILVSGEEVDALSTIVHRSVAEPRGRALIRRLQKEIPRHMFEVPLQAAIGGKVIARENIKALRKNVTAKCYGGDVSRKRKLLEKQKEGKKRMKRVGNVEIPQEAFMSVLSTSEEKRGRN